VRAWVAELYSLEGRFSFLREFGVWLWVAFALGAAARLYLVVSTEGTFDVKVWAVHARWIHEHGLISFYARSEISNPPPLISELLAGLWGISSDFAVPFALLLRAPFALLDLVNGLLLLRLMRGSPARYVAFAAYWLSPLAVIFSAYHGNTDTAVATAALLATLAVVRDRPILAGAALGLGLSIKLPAVLVAPALYLALSPGRRRALFAAGAAATAGVSFLPALVAAPELLYQRVFAYPGLVVTTPGGAPIWGVWNVLGAAIRLPNSVGAVADFHLGHNTVLCVSPIVLMAWLRRERATLPELGWTIAASWLLFYGLTMRFSFQYLAWALPFWIFTGARTYALLTAVLGAYVYGVYSLLCGNALLRGHWDWNAHPFWSGELLLLRDVSVLLCLGLGVGALVTAIRAEASRRVSRASS